MIVSFANYELPARYDGQPWIKIRIKESSTETGAYAQIDEITLVPLDSNPADPMLRSFTTENATIQNGWYVISAIDATGDEVQFDPVYNSPATEIMATLDDINANLDGTVVSADNNNSNLIQISVARVIRAYLSPVIDSTTLMSWATPETTPDTIREIAAKFIASQVYFNQASTTSLTIEERNFAQRLYDEAMAMLQGIIAGTIVIGNGDGTPVTPVDHLSGLDFFPVDDADRAFTVGMEL